MTNTKLVLISTLLVIASGCMTISSLKPEDNDFLDREIKRQHEIQRDYIPEPRPNNG